MRELTPEEREFIERSKHIKGYDVEPLETVVEGSGRGTRSFPWRIVGLLTGVIASLPFFFVGSMMYGFSRVEAAFGHDTMVDLSQMPDDKLNAIGTSTGLTGLPQLMKLYRSKEIIIAGSFSAAFGIIFVIVSLSWIISYRLRTRDARRARRAEKRAKKLEEGTHPHE